ncbi:Rheb small monomeric GTPase [Coniochaeta hoffmannii]|uniref:Rheb small monomeric GTPase n=1 Tax=Coniochaeta hoffmannii TaxID=91930 RepID=A0AA38R215_9PEZI|nr:Rheb small monomeric GTPase [Coniochaeta hoffmannii]
MPSPPKLRKLAIVGSRSVGKSSLAVRYVDNHFVESYYPTIENTFGKEVKIKNQDYALEIVDTAGQDEYSILNSKHLIGIHGYMLVYSVSSAQSFEMIGVIREKILNNIGSEKVPICIVGNKSDLRPEQRQVSFEEGKKLAEKFGCAWTEASARYDVCVAKSFELLIEEIEKSQNPNTPADNGKCAVM